MSTLNESRYRLRSEGVLEGLPALERRYLQTAGTSQAVPQVAREQSLGMDSYQSPLQCVSTAQSL